MEFNNTNNTNNGITQNNIISIHTETIDVSKNNDSIQVTDIPIDNNNQTNNQTNSPIHVLKESIMSMETSIISIKSQVDNIEKQLLSETNKTIQYKQPKIKETPMFKDQNSNKKVKLNVGFNIQRKITQELTNFMKLKENITTLNDATKYIMDYISSNKLQDITNINTRKYINLDVPLKQLFNIQTNEKITYFNIHKYINEHFIQ